MLLRRLIVTYYKSSPRCYEHPRSSMVCFPPPPPDVFHFIFSYNVTKEIHKTSRHTRFRFAFFSEISNNTEFFLANYRSKPTPILN